eukprot:3500779-Amphidinium_carterae.1
MHHFCLCGFGALARFWSRATTVFQAAVFGSGTSRLTKNLADAVLRYKLRTRDEEAKQLLDGHDGYK